MYFPRIRNGVLVAILALLGALPTSGQAVRIGQAAPDFSVTTLATRQTIRLSDFRGRCVLLFMWASW